MKEKLEQLVKPVKKAIAITLASSLIGLTSYCGGGNGGNNDKSCCGIPNNPPVASAQILGVVPSNQYHGWNYVHPGDSVYLDGSLSSDLDGDPLTYLWKKTGVGGTFSDETALDPIFTPGAVEDYTIELLVSDGIDNNTALVYVSARLNQAPTQPDISPGDILGEWESNPITFTATGSTDSDGTFLYAIINSTLPNDPDISFNQSTGVFNWPTDCNDSGSYTLDVVAIDDDDANSVPHTVTITPWEEPFCSVPTN